MKGHNFACAYKELNTTKIFGYSSMYEIGITSDPNHVRPRLQEKLLSGFNSERGNYTCKKIFNLRTAVTEQCNEE